MAYKLTSKGKDRARRTDQPRDPESAVIVLLYENRDILDLEEIAGEIHLTDSIATRVLNRLVSEELVEEV